MQPYATPSPSHPKRSTRTNAIKHFIFRLETGTNCKCKSRKFNECDRNLIGYMYVRKLVKILMFWGKITLIYGRTCFVRTSSIQIFTFIHACRPKQIHIHRCAACVQKKYYYNIDMHKLQFLFTNVRKQHYYIR